MTTCVSILTFFLHSNVFISNIIAIKCVVHDKTELSNQNVSFKTANSTKCTFTLFFLNNV